MARTAAYTSLVSQLKAEQPNLIHELKPGAIMVAIRHHDKSLDGDFDAADFLWVKCSTKKDVGTINGVYRQQRGGDVNVALLHDGRVLDPKSKLSALTRDGQDILVALQATPVLNLLKKATATNVTRSPLGEITNTQRAHSQPNHIKASTSARSASVDTPSSHGARLAPIAPTSAALPPRHSTSSPDATSDNLILDDVQQGFEDFLAERHCHQNSVDFHTARSVASINLKERDDKIADEWKTLSNDQKKFFIERSRSTQFKHTQLFSERVQRWSFWNFYYDHYFQNVTQNPHATFEQSKQYFSSVCLSWNEQPHALRLKRYEAYYDICAGASRRGAVLAPDYRPEAEQFTAGAASNVRPAIKSEGRDLSTISKQSSVSIPHAETDADSDPSDDSSEASDEASDGDRASSVPFKHEILPDTDFHVDLEGSNETQSVAPTRMTMSELFDERTPEQLERAVEQGVELLSSIEKTLKSQPSQDSDQWIKAIENVQKQAVRSRTIVGVVGATGAGKSSVINAMLEQERLVPTNCMRACTAVVTEISYNYDSDGYRAEVEFITRAEWQKQLKILFQELLDGSGNVSRDVANADSEAGIAYAQIKAVYPRMTHEDMESTTIEKLLDHNNVKCLGNVREIKNNDSLMFYKQLQRYVDSKEKTDKKDKDKKAVIDQEYWPLIRVVRLYVKAHALSTGAVIVDLPGVHDSNQARAAVAQSYMKQCTGLWIVAPITRAVDDKSAKHLMGDTFKRQLKLDGGFNDVTFICSKTDDISLTEAQDSLGLEEELGPMWSQTDSLKEKKQKLKDDIEESKKTKSDISAAMEELDDELEVWNDLAEKRSNDDTVYRPKPKSQKRKRTAQSTSPRKKSKYVDSQSDDDFINDDEDEEKSEAGSDDTSSEPDEDQGEPLTDTEITEKVAEIRGNKKDARRQRLDIDEQIKAVRGKIAEVDKELSVIDAAISARCIAGRNDYSRGAIRADYAAGIRELDQELAEEEDAANFDPEQDSRDYDEVARNLPVFCVSSRAYQKLQGRLAKDRAPPGFKHADETEMPALQAHCIQLTGKSRQTSCRRFLTSVFQILNSLRLWSSNDGSGRNLTEGQLARESQILKEKLGKLDTALENTVTALVDGITDDLKDKLFDIMPAAIAAAKAKAGDTVRGWGSHRSEGGLVWATYKAVCRRDGVFTGSRGLTNFNAQLLEPVMSRLASPWETIFSRRLPGVLATLPISASHVMTAFHTDQEKRATRNGASIAAFEMLKQQLAVYRETLKDAMEITKAQITEKQRDANRDLEPKLQESMLYAYTVCVGEVGAGQYNRMKGHMHNHIEAAKQTMFSDCVNHVQNIIKKLLREVKEELLGKVDGIFMTMEREYTSVVLGRETGPNSVLPREQRALRKEVLGIVDGAELRFKIAVGLETEPEPEHQPEAVVQESTEDTAQDMVEDNTLVQGVQSAVKSEDAIIATEVHPTAVDTAAASALLHDVRAENRSDTNTVNEPQMSPFSPTPLVDYEVPGQQPDEDGSYPKAADTEMKED